MGVLDVCAGIGSFSLAARRVGLEIVAQVELESNRREVLNQHFPDVLKLEDIRDVTANDLPRPITILAGGTPCQDLSVAGQRKGLDGTKSQIWYEYLRLAQELTPEWLVWENVPGALSSNGGADFFRILYGLDELGYHVAWRMLDAQYFGVPQRRRRIFLVGHLRDGRSGQVLFERESLPGNLNSRPKAWKKTSRIVGTLSKSASGVSRTGNGNEADFVVYRNRAFGDYTPSKESSTLLKSMGKHIKDIILNTDIPVIYHRGFRGIGYSEQDVASTLEKTGYKRKDNLVIDPKVFNLNFCDSNGSRPDRPNGGLYVSEVDEVNTLTTHNIRNTIVANALLAVELQHITSVANGSKPRNISPTLSKSSRIIAFNPQASATSSRVERPEGIAGTLGTTRVEGVFGTVRPRRLTPKECERLQGFHDDYTQGHSDTQRYAMLGDSIAVPCSQWIMERIKTYS